MTGGSGPDGRTHVAALLREQAGWCRQLGSPLSTELLERAAGDAEGGGPTWTLLEAHAGDPSGSALALRLMGAVHRLVLEGCAPALARHYPSAGGDPSRPAAAWFDFRQLLAEHRERLGALVARPLQTNEVGRSAALLGGFLTVARESGLPIRLLEIGASAGLNLRWDHYRYESGSWAWGDATSPVVVSDVFAGTPPRLDVPARVAARAGCDPSPVDPTTRDGMLALRAYVWPDQIDRHRLLTGALAVARRVPAVVEAADASTWLPAALAVPTPGTATVVYHSITWQYLSAAERGTLRAALADAGRRATTAAPLAWLRLEPEGRAGPYTVRLTTWPDGGKRLLAETHPHGRPVRWLGG